MDGTATRSSINILLVEDNPGDARLIREMLTEARDSFVLKHVECLSAGLARLAEDEIDLILLDLSLPDSQGFDTFVRMHSEAPQIPIILLTGLDDNTLAVQAVQQGAQDYLIKGEFESNFLERAIRYAIERQQLVIALRQQTDALFHSEVRLHNMIEHNADGIIIVDEQGLIRFANPAAERLYGRLAVEFLNEPFGTPVATANPIELNIFRWNEPDVNIIVEMIATETVWEGQPAYLATLRDITERKRMEAELHQKNRLIKLLQEVAITANEATNVKQVMQDVVDRVCAHTGWPVGHAHIPAEESGDKMEASDVWHLADAERFRKFWKMTMMARLGAGLGLLGRALEAGEPVWERDISNNPEFVRATAARDAGLHAGIAFPVLAGTDVVAALEFFSENEESPDTSFLDVMGQIGTQLGRVVERHRAEQALRSSEDRFRRVVTSITDHVYSTEMTSDGQRLNQYLSPNIEEFTGYPIEKFIDDWSFWPEVVIHPDDQAAAAVQARRLAEGQDSEVEYRLVKADGEVIWVRDNARVEKRPNTTVVYGVVSNISQQKQTHAEMMRLYSEANQRAQQLAVMHELDRAISSSLHIEEVYRAFSDYTSLLLPYDRMSVVLLEAGRLRVSFVAGLVNPPIGSELPAGDKSVSGQVIARKKPLLINDVTTETEAGGDILWATGIRSVMVLPLSVKQQTIGTWNISSKQSGAYSEDDLHIAQLLVDQLALGIENARLYQQAQQEIMERKQAQQLLEAEQALLAQRVKERTAELSKANTKLARAARLKDEFLANMSHELRTPLNAILGMSEVLQTEVYGALNEEQRGALAQIESGGRHLLEVVTDILDLSKIEADKLELVIGPIHVGDTCQASLLFVKQMAQKKRIQILSTIDVAVEIIYADQLRLKQILVNLLNNAVKFTPEGGQVGLEVIGDRVRQMVHFTVWDTGIGIRQDDMKHLFQPFIQLDSSLSRHHEGTGLGLVLVSRLADLHGGSVSVESEVGAGSRFTVSLPWQPDDEGVTGAGSVDQPGTDETEAQSVASTPSDSSAGIVLLAEDNETNVIMVRDILRSKGYTVIVARNGLEAIDLTSQERPDIILMDIQMPGMNGLEAIRRIRADEDAAVAQTPIIALTALAMTGDKERCLEAGADAYLSKPASLQALLRLVEQQLRMPADH